MRHTTGAHHIPSHVVWIGGLAPQPLAHQKSCGLRGEILRRFFCLVLARSSFNLSKSDAFRGHRRLIPIQTSNAVPLSTNNTPPSCRPPPPLPPPPQRALVMMMMRMPLHCQPHGHGSSSPKRGCVLQGPKRGGQRSPSRGASRSRTTTARSLYT